MIPTWRFIFIEFPKPFAQTVDGWFYSNSLLNSICPDCNKHLKVGIQIINEKNAFELIGIYYSHCYACGFDLKHERELGPDGFDYERFMSTI